MMQHLWQTICWRRIPWFEKENLWHQQKWKNTVFRWFCEGNTPYNLVRLHRGRPCQFGQRMYRAPCINTKTANFLVPEKKHKCMKFHRISWIFRWEELRENFMERIETSESTRWWTTHSSEKLERMILSKEASNFFIKKHQKSNYFTFYGFLGTTSIIANPWIFEKILQVKDTPPKTHRTKARHW